MYESVRIRVWQGWVDYVPYAQAEVQRVHEKVAEREQ